jgi:hypothetical protein
MQTRDEALNHVGVTRDAISCIFTHLKCFKYSVECTVLYAVELELYRQWRQMLCVLVHKRMPPN